MNHTIAVDVFKEKDATDCFARLVSSGLLRRIGEIQQSGLLPRSTGSLRLTDAIAGRGI
jgi:hypothetical protein